MDETGFWKVVEDSKLEALRRSECIDSTLLTSNIEGLLIERLQTILASIPLSEVSEFKEQWARKKLDLNTWEHWAVAFIIHAGCSDDGFDSYRDWIIFQGQAFFRAAVNNPEFVAETVSPGEYCLLESIGWVPYEVYEDRAKEPLKASELVKIKTRGSEWSEEDLPTHFPEACLKFGFAQ